MLTEKYEWMILKQLEGHICVQMYGSIVPLQPISSKNIASILPLRLVSNRVHHNDT